MRSEWDRYDYIATECQAMVVMERVILTVVVSQRYKILYSSWTLTMEAIKQIADILLSVVHFGPFHPLRAHQKRLHQDWWEVSYHLHQQFEWDYSVLVAYFLVFVVATPYPRMTSERILEAISPDSILQQWEADYSCLSNWVSLNVWSVLHVNFRTAHEGIPIFIVGFVILRFENCLLDFCTQCSQVFLLACTQNIPLLHNGGGRVQGYLPCAGSSAGLLPDFSAPQISSRDLSRIGLPVLTC